MLLMLSVQYYREIRHLILQTTDKKGVNRIWLTPDVHGTPSRIRTCNLRLRRPLLYYSLVFTLLYPTIYHSVIVPFFAFHSLTLYNIAYWWGYGGGTCYVKTI